MTESVKLEGCPFCGGPAQIIAGAPGCYYVRCEGCSVTSDDGSRERVITKWNTRHQPQREAVLEALKNIAAPLAYLQRQAEAEGNQLDGAVALRLAGNAEFLKRIAREALDAATLTTPAPAVSRDDQALFDDICDKMAEVVAPLPCELPNALGDAGTRATESGDGDEA